MDKMRTVINLTYSILSSGPSLHLICEMGCYYQISKSIKQSKQLKHCKRKILHQYSFLSRAQRGAK